ncbi:hypothetical protein LLH03_12600 [bacterium]|nr:hypothetical protein [bacterium]
MSPALSPGVMVFGPQAALAACGAPLLPAEAAEVHGYALLPKGDQGALRAEWWWQARPMGEMPVGLGRLPALGIVAHVELRAAGGKTFGPGVGEVEVTRSGQRVARGSFTTAAKAQEILAQEQPPTIETRITRLQTARGTDAQGKAVSPGADFEGTEKVWAVFNFQGADVGAAFTVRWYCEGHELAAARCSVPVKAAEGSGTAWLAPGKGQALPPAKYKVTVSYGSDVQVLGEAEWQVVAGRAASGNEQEELQ